MSNIALSNFLIYSEFFIDIAKKYTNIDFIFRPHPLLFINLEKYWKKTSTAIYIKTIKTIKRKTTTMVATTQRNMARRVTK